MGLEVAPDIQAIPGGRVRILYIHQYFCTRNGRSGTRSYEFARRLVAHGHQVTMLTSDSDLSDLRIPAGKRSARFDIDGIDVRVVRVAYSQRMSSLARMWSFVQFMALSSWEALRASGHDVVFATSTPLTVAVPGLLASLVHRRPLVFEVRDLWPEAPIQMGVIRNRVVIALLRAFERFVYRQSRAVIALSPGMRDGVMAAGTPPRKITVIPNCSDLDLFRPGEADPALVERFGLQGRFVVAYAGSMGEANEVTSLLEAAALLQSTGVDDVRFLLIGQGKQADDVRSDVERRGLRHIVFAGSMTRSQVAEALRASDVCLVLFKNLPVLATNSPNKLFDALATGRPVIVNSNGWTRALCEQHGVGRYAEAGSAEALAREILWLARHAEETTAMGHAARELAESQFDRNVLARQFEEVLAAAAGLAMDDEPRSRPRPTGPADRLSTHPGPTTRAESQEYVAPSRG